MSFSFAGDMKNTAFTGLSIVPGTTISTDTTTNGTAVDCQLSDDLLTAVISLGNSGDASTTIALKLQESATSGGTYTDITGATASLAASASANDNTITLISTRLRSLRWVRVVAVTAGGGTPSVPICATLIGRKKITGTGTGYVT